MQTHFHPSVSVFAAALLDKGNKMPKPDLDSHSLIRFLDKFVYRNPKASDTTRGVSIMQPLKANKDSGDIWLGSRGASTAGTQVNTAAFWNKKARDVAAEDVFFHEYFQHVPKEPKTKRKAASAEEPAEGEDDEQEDEIWKALVDAQPDIDDGGSEEGFDLDDEDMASVGDSEPELSLGEESDGGVSIERDDGDEDDAMDDDEGDELDGLVQFEDEEEDDDDDVKGEKTDARSEKNKKEKSRRKMLRGLPTFASVDDYAEMLANEEDGLEE